MKYSSSPSPSSSSSFAFYDPYDVGFTGDKETPTQTRTNRKGSIEPLSNDEEARHFLDTCFLCKKLLSRNRDIFMYRGDTPFCSEECRHEQITIDEAKEKGWRSSSEEKQKQKQRNKPKQNSQRIPVPVWAW